MAHTFTSMFMLIIFSTKNRDLLLHAEMKPRLFEYMGGIIRNMGGTSLLINGPKDHVHILTVFPSTVPLSHFMRDLKGDSSGWAKGALETQDFAWQTGYAAFSVSKSNVDAVRTYIANQEDHHKRVTFQTEYLEFLKRHGVDYDERFVFD